MKIGGVVRIAAAVILASSCGSLAAQVNPGPVSAPAIQTEYFTHPDNENKKIEVFWAKPDRSTPSPAIILLHGHQEPERPGGKVYVDTGVLEQMAAAGYVAIAISQPGYGGSDGPPDYCGPFTQRAVLHVIQEFRRRPFVRPREIAIQGVSRGAMVAAMVAAQDSQLAAVVLISGLFDLSRILKVADSSLLAKAMAANLRFETNGAGEKALRERSALFVADNIRVPTLILNGAKDDRTDPELAKQLAAKIQAHGTPTEAVIYPDYGHSIPPEERSKVVGPFLSRYLKP